MILDMLIALVFYPGLLTIVAAGMLLAFAAGIRIPGPAALRGIQRTAGGIALLLSCGLLVGATTFIRLPLQPALVRWPVASIPLSWVVLEMAFLLPALPAIVSQRTLVGRAASREAQLGVAGRVAFWVAVSAGFAAGSALADVPGRLLALVAGFMALPAAAGLGPFAAEASLAPAPDQDVFDGASQAFLPLLRHIRAGVLVLVLAAAVIPPAWVTGPQAMIGAGSVAGIVLLAGVLLTQLVGRPRLTLPAGLHWCWRRALPLALAGLVYVLTV
jgi:hypothetical protein